MDLICKYVHGYHIKIVIFFVQKCVYNIPQQNYEVCK